MAAGVATLAFSLVVSIAPAMAAKGGNAADFKIHDAATALEAVGNEPQVCEFWVGFYSSDPADAGTWQVLGWPPTGDGTVVASGSYETAGDGVDTTGLLAVPNGHYRFESQSNSDANSKQKTFWVACEATESGSDPSDGTPPTDEADPSGDEEVMGEEDTPPTNQAGPDDENPDATDDGGPSPEEGVLGGNPGPVASPPASEGNAAPADDAAAELPDTSIPVQPSGVLATIGVLLIIAAHMGTRRARSLPTV